MTHIARSVAQGQSPRIAVTIPAEVYALYKAFSQVSGQSMSSLLAEIAVSSVPALEKVLRVAIAAKEANQARREGMLQAAERAEAQLLPLLQRAQQTLGIALDDMAAVATAGAQPRSRRAGGAKDPRPSNTGVRSPRKQGKNGRR